MGMESSIGLKDRIGCVWEKSVGVVLRVGIELSVVLQYSIACFVHVIFLPRNGLQPPFCSYLNLGVIGDGDLHVFF